MSAVRIARDVVVAEDRALSRVRGAPDDGRSPSAPMAPNSSSRNQASDAFQGALDKLTKWIPGDTLAIYAPGVTLLGVTADEPSLLFLIIMILVTPLFVLGVAFSTGGTLSRQIVMAAILAMAAFAIWSLSIPSNGWQSLSLIADNKGVVAVGAAIVGILFGYFAEGITKRVAL
jgi:hypothetical protein